jgi:hypothetical protein
MIRWNKRFHTDDFGKGPRGNSFGKGVSPPTFEVWKKGRGKHLFKGVVP